MKQGYIDPVEVEELAFMACTSLMNYPCLFCADAPRCAHLCVIQEGGKSIEKCAHLDKTNMDKTSMHRCTLWAKDLSNDHVSVFSWSADDGLANTRLSGLMVSSLVARMVNSWWRGW